MPLTSLPFWRCWCVSRKVDLSRNLPHVSPRGCYIKPLLEVHVFKRCSPGVVTCSSSAQDLYSVTSRVTLTRVVWSLWGSVWVLGALAPGSLLQTDFSVEAEQSTTTRLDLLQCLCESGEGTPDETGTSRSWIWNKKNTFRLEIVIPVTFVKAHP